MISRRTVILAPPVLLASHLGLSRASQRVTLASERASQPWAESLHYSGRSHRFLGHHVTTVEDYVLSVFLDRWDCSPLSRVGDYWYHLVSVEAGQFRGRRNEKDFFLDPLATGDTRQLDNFRELGAKQLSKFNSLSWDSPDRILEEAKLLALALMYNS